MPITVPADGDIISATTFGAPVANQLNSINGGLEATKVAANRLFYATDTKRLWVHDGSGWIIVSEPSQTWAPSFANNIVVGNGAFSAYYMRSNGWCDIWFRFTFGSTSTISGSPTINLPFPAFNLLLGQLHITYYDAGAGMYSMGLMNDNPTAYANQVAGTYATIALLSSAIPFTWVANSRFDLSGRYRMNSPYT